jgi:hypothetical protein
VAELWWSRASEMAEKIEKEIGVFSGVHPWVEEEGKNGKRRRERRGRGGAEKVEKRKRRGGGK